MPRPHRAAALVAAFAAAALASLAPAVAPAAAASEDAAGYTFVSSPDFLNADVGDVSGEPGWDGLHNSISPSVRQALDFVLDSFAAERPDDVLVAGDLVEGHWGMDSLGTGIFGLVDTRAARLEAVRDAGRIYYGQWRQRFVDRGLPVHAAVGDHEIGDNDWDADGPNPYSAFKHDAFRVFKNTFARHIVTPGGYAMRPRGAARRTAYATYLDPEVLLVSVDVFRRTDRRVVPQLDSDQLVWLGRVLRRARARGTDWILVQGHTPVLGPVRERSSSGLMYRRGADSAFWQTMRRHRVDLYLSGEVHDITLRRLHGITQISHGGLFGWGGTNYLRGEVLAGRRLRLTAVDFQASHDATTRLWTTDARKATPSSLSYTGRAPVGSVVLSHDNEVVARGTGMLAPYVG